MTNVNCVTKYKKLKNRISYVLNVGKSWFLLKGEIQTERRIRHSCMSSAQQQ